MQLKGDSVSGAIICGKGKQMHNDLRAKPPSSSDGDAEEFKGSRCWFKKLQKQRKK